MQHRMIRLSRLATLLAVTALVAPTDAATPTSPVRTNSIPQLQLSWLGALSVNPASVVVGSDVTGTVTLLRPAIENLQISLLLAGAEANEMGIQVAPNAVAPMSVTVPTGAGSATFKISTGAKAGVTLAKSYTIKALYGKESKTASFTVTQLTKIQRPGF